MVGKIIDGISIKLNEVFGDEYEIYSEEIKQGFQEPCFFILPLNLYQKQIVGQRYFKGNFFDIHYLPKRENSNADIYYTAEILFQALEYITVESDNLRGTNMHYEKIDGVLHFFVEYNNFILKPTEKTSMEEIAVSSGLKE